jgi:hypothetical protein
MASRIGVSSMQMWCRWGRHIHTMIKGYIIWNQATMLNVWIYATRYKHIRTGVILFTEEASFTRDCVNNSRNVHTWLHDNPLETSVTNIQRRFSVNVWCGVVPRTFCAWQQFNGETRMKHPWGTSYSTRFVGRYPVNGKEPNVLPTWRGSPTLLSTREGVLKCIRARCMATEVARSYTSWLLHLGPYEDVSLRN